MKRQRRDAPSKRQIRLDKDLEKEIREEEEDEVIVEYMDSDEEEKKKKRKKLKETMDQSSDVEVEKEVGDEVEKEAMYSLLPMPEWIPAENPPAFTVLRFWPAAFPSSYQAQVKRNVRSTILGQYGRSVIIGPPPVEQRQEKCFSTSMLMVTSEQLQAHLSHQADRFRPAVKVPPGTMRRATHRRVEYELKAAVTPWVGNLMIPSRSPVTMAAKLREQGQKKVLSSTTIFLLFLQTMNVDSVGCKEMIKKRKSEMIFPPSPDSPSRLKDPKTLAGMLQRRRRKQELQDFQIQQSVSLEQVQQQKLLLPPRPCPRHHPASAVPPQASSLQGLTASHQSYSAVLQIPPQMNPALLPRAVFIPQSSFASLLPLTSSSGVTVAFPVPLPPRPFGPAVSPSATAAPDVHLSSPLISTGPPMHTVISSCALPQLALPVTQNLLPDSASVYPNTTLPPDRQQLGPPPAASRFYPPLCDHNYTADPTVAPTCSFDSRMRKQREELEPRRTSSYDGQHGGETGDSGGRFRECEPGLGAEGKRLRKLSQRARAFQEAAKAKVRHAEEARLSHFIVLI